MTDSTSIARPASHTLPPEPARPEALRAIDAVVGRLRAEAGAADKTRRARLLVEIGEVEERVRDEAGAIRDYLEALNADGELREAGEALLRLFERRRSMKHTGRVVDALFDAALTSDDRVRALTMKALLVADASGDPATALQALSRAAAEHDASERELAPVRLLVELFAAKAGDTTARTAALVARARAVGEPTWRALLLVDAARLVDEEGRSADALSLLEEAATLEGEARFAVARRTEVVARDILKKCDGDDRVRAQLALATSLEAQGRLVATALHDPARGDAEGVPRHARSAASMAHALLRGAEVLHDAGDVGRAGRLLDEGLKHSSTTTDVIVRARLLSARIRFAEELGDTALASTLATERLASEQDPGVRASLALHIAEHAASIGDGEGAQRALAQAAESDRTSVPARALALDLAATGGEPATFAAQLEGLASELPTAPAAARALLFAAVVWAIEARDETSAKAALAQAAERGTSQRVVGELARGLASVIGSSTWYDEGTRRLQSEAQDQADPSEAQAGRANRNVEMVRARLVRGDTSGAAKLLADLSANTNRNDSGAWLGSLLLSFLPTGHEAGITTEQRSAAIERLVALETRPDVRLGLGLLGAHVLVRSGDVQGSRKRLQALFEDQPDSTLLAVCLSNVERSLGHGKEAAATLQRAASASSDRELAAALELEAGFLLWDGGARAKAVEAFDAAAGHVPGVAVLARAWAGRGIPRSDAAARARTIDDAEAAGESPMLSALERWAASLASRDRAATASALVVLEESAEGHLATGAAVARLIAPGGSEDDARFERAATRLSLLGGGAEALAAAEQFAVARGRGPAEAARAASRWFSLGGDVTAGLEWLAASIAKGDGAEEARARRAIGQALSGDARESFEASAALVEHLSGDRREGVAPIAGSSDAVRLANLELAPPGSDPRRREVALRGLGPSLGDDARLDALGLSAWSLLVAGENQRAVHVFEQVASARPTDISAWEGLRSAAEALRDLDRRAIACSELGNRCLDASRGAAFFEEAGLVHLERGNEAAGEKAFGAAFSRDPRRALSFDKLFRRIRERRDGEALLGIVQLRLEVSDDPVEISKLFWEQARVLREKGDVDGALKALENVTMIEPDHVGALALTGEIFIKRGQFEQAAERLAALAALREAPAKNRLTAGIAAVDLYENKLDRFDLALDVLIALHKAGLSTTPVRERLARAAARTGAWNEAIAILEQLMQERSEPSGRIEAARLAMAIHRDRLRAPERAIAPVLKLLEEAPSDGEAIDMLLGLALPEGDKRTHLMKARGVLLTAMRLNPVDVANAERLVRITRALGDEEGESVALSITAAFGSVSAGSSLASIAQRKPRAPEVALTDERFAALLAPGDDGPLATLFVMLAPTLSEALGPSLLALGITKRDKVDPKSGLALRNEIAAWAGAFGIASFDLYVGGRDATAVQGVPGDVPSLVVGPEVQSPLDAKSKARVARELLGLVRGTTVLRLRDETTIASIVVASCRLADVPIESPAYAVLGEIEKAINKAIPRKMKKAIHEVCRDVATAKPDPRDFRRRALASQARAAVLASGDVAFVLSEMLEGALERVQGSVRADERATELLRFVLSPTYTELRRSLGLERA